MKVFICIIIAILMFMVVDIMILAFIDFLSGPTITIQSLAQTEIHIYLVCIFGFTYLCCINGVIQEIHYEIFKEILD